MVDREVPVRGSHRPGIRVENDDLCDLVPSVGLASAISSMHTLWGSLSGGEVEAPVVEAKSKCPLSESRVGRA